MGNKKCSCRLRHFWMTGATGALAYCEPVCLRLFRVFTDGADSRVRGAASNASSSGGKRGGERHRNCDKRTTSGASASVLVVRESLRRKRRWNDTGRRSVGRSDKRSGELVCPLYGLGDTSVLRRVGQGYGSVDEHNVLRVVIGYAGHGEHNGGCGLYARVHAIRLPQVLCNVDRQRLDGCCRYSRQGD